MKNTPLLLLTLIFSLLIVPTTYAASGGDGDLKISDSYDKEKAEAEAEAKAKAAAEAKAKEKAAAEAKAKAYETTAKAKEAAELRAKAKEAEAKAKAAAEEQSKSKTEAKNTNQDSKSQEGKNDNNSSQQVEITAQVDENSLQDAGNGNIKMPTEEQLQAEGERRQEEEQDERTRMVDVVNQEDERQRNQDETQDEIDERLREQRAQEQQEARERDDARDEARHARQRATIDIEERARERRERETAANALEERQRMAAAESTRVLAARQAYIESLSISKQSYVKAQTVFEATWPYSEELVARQRAEGQDVGSIRLRAAINRRGEIMGNLARLYTRIIQNYSTLIDAHISERSATTISAALTSVNNSVNELSALRSAYYAAVSYQATLEANGGRISREEAERMRYRARQIAQQNERDAENQASSELAQAEGRERHAEERVEQSEQARESFENETPEERARAIEEQGIVDEVRILSNYADRLSQINWEENRDLTELQNNPFGRGASEQELANSLREQAYFELNQFLTADPNPYEENTRMRDEAAGRINSAHNALRDNWNTPIPEACSQNFEVVELGRCPLIACRADDQCWSLGYEGMQPTLIEIQNQLIQIGYHSIRERLLSIKAEFLSEFASTNLEELLRLNNNNYNERNRVLQDNRWTLRINAEARYESLLRQQPQYTEYQIETIRIQDAADDQRTEALRIRDAALAALEEN
jgi:hypothetical protein